MRITALSGGIGGARFLRGLLRVLAPGDEVVVIGNTADDIWLFGLKVCPDLDTVMYTLGSGIDDERGWGRRDETWHAKEELAAYGVEPTWFGLGDRDLATHVVRTQMLQAGYSLTDVTTALCDRWLAYTRAGAFPGGCFIFSVAAEYDAKPGRVRDEIAEARRRWLSVYEAVIASCRRRGELDPGVDPAALAFELDALGMAANLHAQLCDDGGVHDRVRAAIMGRLQAVATSPHPALR